MTKTCFENRKHRTHQLQVTTPNLCDEELAIFSEVDSGRKVIQSFSAKLLFEESDLKAQDDDDAL
jgi:hypothetical protein